MATYKQDIRTTDTVLTDQQPPSWTETIHELMPGTKAKLAALVTNLDRIEVDSDEIKSYERGLLNRNMTVVSDNGGNALVVGAGEAYRAPKGSLLISMSTGRIVRVTADTLDGATFVSPTRTIDGGSAVTFSAGEKLYLLSYAGEEAAEFPTAIDRDPSIVTNYLQEFETTYEVSNKMVAKHDRTGDPLANAQREAFTRYAIDKEQAFLFGKAVDAGKIKLTGGITNFISTNAAICTDGMLTPTFWDDFLYAAMQYKSDYNSEKTLFCGSSLMKAVLNLERDRGTMNLQPGADRFGIKMNKLITFNGDLNVLVHPLFDENPVWRYNGIIVDLANVSYKYLKGNDDNRIQLVQNNLQSVDGSFSKAIRYAFHSICGLDVRHEKTHALITNVQRYAGK